MLKKTISSIESAIRRIHSIDYERKTELLKLLDTLKTEVNVLGKENPEQARSIAGFTEIAAHEATRVSQNPGLTKISQDGLMASVKEFETSHPILVDTANDICVLLSRLGI